MRALFLAVTACSVGCLAPVAVEPIARGSSSGGGERPADDAPEGEGTTGDPAETTGGVAESGSTSTRGESSGGPEPSTTSGAEGSSSSSGGELLEGCDAHPDALLCADFESAIDEGLWEIRTAEGGSIDVVDGVLRVELQSAAGARGFIRTTDIFPLPDNRFFGRVMFRIAPESPSFHDYLLAAAGPLDGSQARYRLDSNGGGSLNSRYTHASVEQHGGLRKHGYDTVPETWTCIEWEFDGSTDSIRFWFDGEFNEDMFVDGAVEDPPWVAPEFDSFEIGYQTYQAPDNAEAFEILYDDLVLDTERIGCPTAYRG